MNLKRLILIILTVSAINAFGQNNLVGIKAGINRTNMTGESLSYKHVNKMGFSGGITTDYFLFNFLSIGVDFIYEQRGFNDTLYMNNVEEVQQNQKYPFTESYDYLSVPIKVSFNYGNNLYGFGSIGFVASYLKHAQIDGAPIPENITYYIGKFYGDVTNYRSTIDIAGLAEIGIGYKFNGIYWLYTAVSIQQSFTSNIKSKEIYHEGMALTLGIKKAI